MTWSYGQKYGMTLEQMAQWWSEKPAKLVGQQLKVNRSTLYHYDGAMGLDLSHEISASNSVYVLV